MYLRILKKSQRTCCIRFAKMEEIPWVTRRSRIQEMVQDAERLLNNMQHQSKALSSNMQRRRRRRTVVVVDDDSTDTDDGIVSTCRNIGKTPKKTKVVTPQLSTATQSWPNFGLAKVDKGATTAECNICGKQLKCGELGVLISCEHYFHAHELKTWQQTRKASQTPFTCPTCRRNFDGESLISQHPFFGK